VIKGLVVDGAGQPVAGAAIYVISAPVPLPDIAQLSGLDGSFAVAAPAPGTYVLGARSDESGSGQSTIAVRAGEEMASEVTIRLSFQ